MSKRIAPHILRRIDDIGTRKALEQNVDKPDRPRFIQRSSSVGSGRVVQGQPEDEDARPQEFERPPRRRLRRVR